jgi:hypothetical protein
MIGLSKMTEKLHDMTSKWMLLDVSILPKKEKKQILIIPLVSLNSSYCYTSKPVSSMI